MISSRPKIVLFLILLLAVFPVSLFSQRSQGDTAPLFKLKRVGYSNYYSFPNNLQQPTVIFFWDASEEEIEDLKTLDALVEKYPNAFQVISIFFGGRNEWKIKSLLQKHSIDLVTLLTNNQVEARYKVEQTPAIFIIDASNRIVFSKTGFRLTSEVLSVITNLFLGSLTVSCIRNGADVYLNDGWIGKISSGRLTILDLNPGTYRLQVQKTDEYPTKYTTFWQYITVSKGANTTVNAIVNIIPPPLSSLTVQCNRNGSNVYLDDRWKGIISFGGCIISGLRSGTYNLRVRTKKDETFSQYIKIYSGRDTTITVTFKPEPSSLFVRIKATLKNGQSLGSNAGFFAGYPIPLGNLKNAADSRSASFGARLRLINRTSLAWDFTANYYRFNKTTDFYQLNSKIIPITFNGSVGRKNLHFTGGAGYYFFRYKVESVGARNTTTFKDKRNDWGLNAGMEFGFSNFEIGTRYHYVPKNSRKNFAKIELIDIYGGITLSISKEAPRRSEWRKTTDFAFTYTTFPASADINPQYVKRTEETSKPIKAARLYRVSVTFWDTHGIGIDLGLGYLPLGELHPAELDVNLMQRVFVVPKRLDFYFAGGVGVLFLMQDFAQPAFNGDIDFDPTGSAEAIPGFGQVFCGLRFSLFEPVSIWGDFGYISNRNSSKWRTNDTFLDERMEVRSNWLRYQNLKFGGRWVRVGVVFTYFHKKKYW